MGKIGKDEEHVQQEEQRQDDEGARCSVIRRAFSFKCLFILFFSLAAFVSVIFWIIPKHKFEASFVANDVIKHRGKLSTFNFVFSLFHFPIVIISVIYCMRLDLRCDETGF